MENVYQWDCGYVNAAMEFTVILMVDEESDGALPKKRGSDGESL